MGVNLVKGQKVKLVKEGTTDVLTSIMVGLGWDPKPSGSAEADFDLDASVYMLDANKKVTSPQGLIFFNNKTSPCGAIVHQGDNLTGEGDGDDEKINIDLTKIPAEIVELVVVVDIYQAVSRKQNFGMIEDSGIRLYDTTSGSPVEVLHFDLNFDASIATGVVFASIKRKDADWVFTAVQTEFAGGLDALNTQYGV